MPTVPKYKLKPLSVKTEKAGRTIAKLRKNAGLTQEDLAQKIGISRKLVTDYETGRLRMYDEMIIRFALALDVNTDVLLGLNKKDTLKSFPGLRVMKRMKEIEKLPEAKRKAILKTVDDLIRANK